VPDRFKYISNTNAELCDMKKKLMNNTELSEKGFQHNNEKTTFYTGIANFAILINVFNLVAPHIHSSSRNVLNFSLYIWVQNTNILINKLYSYL
jgi:hypothetical protein